LDESKKEVNSWISSIMDNRDFMDNMSLAAGIDAQKGYQNNPERTSSAETDDFSTGKRRQNYIDYEPSHIQNWIKTNRRINDQYVTFTQRSTKDRPKKCPKLRCDPILFKDTSD